MSDGERGLLRWGGLAGVLAAIFLVLTAVTLFGFVPPAPADPRALVARYPDTSTANFLGESFNLVSVIFSVVFYLALYRALGRSNLAPALWGTALSFLGLGILALEMVPRVAFGRISDLYHAPGASPQDQATLALVWKTTQGLFAEFDTAATIFLTAGYVVLGIAMLRSPAFGNRFGGITMVLGLVGLIGVDVLGISSTFFAAIGLLVLIVLPIVLGLKIYRLSRATTEVASAR